MKTTINLIFILLILISCSQPADNLTLVFPTGRYTDWTTYESINLAFKLNGGQLTVDRNYNFETKEFAFAGLEKSIDYPATTELLRKRFDELRTLSKEFSDDTCSRLTPIYVEYKTEEGTDVISFRTIGECLAGSDTLSGIAKELWMLREKYAR